MPGFSNLKDAAHLAADGGCVQGHCSSLCWWPLSVEGCSWQANQMWRCYRHWRKQRLQENLTATQKMLELPRNLE